MLATEICYTFISGSCLPCCGDVYLNNTACVFLRLTSLPKHHSKTSASSTTPVGINIMTLTKFLNFETRPTNWLAGLTVTTINWLIKAGSLHAVVNYNSTVYQLELGTLGQHQISLGPWHWHYIVGFLSVCSEIWMS